MRCSIGMRSEVEYSPVGEGLGMREYWLYVWMRRVAVIAAHVIALGLTILMSLLSRPGTSLFSWHPVCMSAAFCLCMTEGILLFSTECTPFCFKSRQAKVRMHWFLQALVLAGGAGGLAFMVASKSLSERPHLTTWHGWLGASTLVATVLQAGCGVGLLLSPRLRLGTAVSRLRLYHATCGLLAYLLSTGTVVLAVCSDWFQATVRGPPWYAFLLLPFFPALVVMNQITNAYLPKKKLSS
ncbi:probable transmembrane reductase CYB561D1 [Brienomyrus brachyistius]|uniref:probable transmembrane reductase CYB561D1 n=1 Tax=Brienomyrus brachyistius TaxID=42636 RepID=UPI0020B3A418|nr:probable transmembrane reductase CYB561D1 [Brienomyrus brachyistius]